MTIHNNEAGTNYTSQEMDASFRSRAESAATITQ